MFELLSKRRPRAPHRGVTPVVISTAAHLIIVAVLVTVPVMYVATELPEVPEVLAFVASAPVPAPPPPPPPPAAIAKAEPRVTRPVPVTRAVVPIQPPTEIGEELTVDSAPHAGSAGSLRMETREAPIPGALRVARRRGRRRQMTRPAPARSGGGARASGSCDGGATERSASGAAGAAFGRRRDPQRGRNGASRVSRHPFACWGAQIGRAEKRREGIPGWRRRATHAGNGRSARTLSLPTRVVPDSIARRRGMHRRS